MTKRGEKMQAEVLAALRRSSGPLSAYAVLDCLSRNHPKIAPQTIYRALAALTERGLVHRLESLSAYVACRRGGDGHAAVLSICDECGAVEESAAPELHRDLSGIVGKSGFSPTRQVIEVRGSCGACVENRSGA